MRHIDRDSGCVHHNTASSVLLNVPFRENAAEIMTFSMLIMSLGGRVLAVCAVVEGKNLTSDLPEHEQKKLVFTAS